MIEKVLAYGIEQSNTPFTWRCTRLDGENYFTVGFGVDGFFYEKNMSEKHLSLAVIWLDVTS